MRATGGFPGRDAQRDATILGGITAKEFYAAAPVVAAVWMLAGLPGGLAPTMVRSVFHLNSPFLGGFAGFVAPAVAAVILTLISLIAQARLKRRA